MPIHQPFTRLPVWLRRGLTLLAVVLLAALLGAGLLCAGLRKRFR